jgi:hypothetical protein
MKNTLKSASITLGLGLMLTTLCQAQQGNPGGTPSAAPLSLKVPPHALSAISFSAAPNTQCSVAPAGSSGTGQGFKVYADDGGTATFYMTPSKESSAVQLVATCSSGSQQTIEIQPVAGAKPLVAHTASDAATNQRLGHTLRPALTGDPMALSNQELVKRGYPLRPDPQRAPGAYASWLKAVSKPSTFIPPKTVNVEGPHHGPAKIADDAGSSYNWSGYLVQGSSSPFYAVAGTWNVQSVFGVEPGIPAYTPTYSSFWIGLDGWVNTDLAQDGTSEETYVDSNGNAYNSWFAWVQLLPQEQDEQPISNFPINPYDEIYSMVAIGDAYANPNLYGGYSWFFLEDLTTNQSTFFATQINSGTFAGGTAEWIMERPENTTNGSYYDLSDYWLATMQGPWAVTTDGTWVNFFNGGDGATSTNLTMVNTSNGVLSLAIGDQPNGFDLFWQNYH